jgi:hypothetical protein
MYLVLLFAGIAALVAAGGVTRFHWRPDIPPYDRGTRALQVLLHPERYAKDAPLRAIRALSVAGAILLVGAAGIVLYDVLRAVMGP